MHFPQTFTKGNLRRTASSQADVVALQFDGFRPLNTVSADEPYSDLQKQAKELGIPANQSREELVQAIADELGDDE